MTMDRLGYNSFIIAIALAVHMRMHTVATPGAEDAGNHACHCLSWYICIYLKAMSTFL